MPCDEHEKKKRRRLLKIRTSEVSLVDDPAVPDATFLISKRREPGDDVEKFNPYHGEGGKFSSGEGGGSARVKPRGAPGYKEPAVSAAESAREATRGSTTVERLASQDFRLNMNDDRVASGVLDLKDRMREKEVKHVMRVKRMDREANEAEESGDTGTARSVRHDIKRANSGFKSAQEVYIRNELARIKREVQTSGGVKKEQVAKAEEDAMVEQAENAPEKANPKAVEELTRHVAALAMLSDKLGDDLAIIVQSFVDAVEEATGEGDDEPEPEDGEASAKEQEAKQAEAEAIAAITEAMKPPAKA